MLYAHNLWAVCLQNQIYLLAYYTNYYLYNSENEI